MRPQTPEDRLAAVIRGQYGRVTRAQLVALGMPHSTISRRLRSGYLTRVLPKVYAVGHTAPSHEADLWAAILYAGPGACSPTLQPRTVEA